MSDKWDEKARALFKCVCDYGIANGDQDSPAYHEPHCPAPRRGVIAIALREAAAEERPGPVGVQLLSLFNPHREGPLTDRELKDILDASWAFLLDKTEHKSNLAFLVFKLTKELTEYRTAISKTEPI